MSNLKELLSVTLNPLARSFFADDFSEEVTKYDDEDQAQAKANLVGVQIECVDSYGGEGQGDTYYSVYSFKKDGEEVFVKFDGYYASYCGSEYTEWFFVEPLQVTKTEYHRA